MCVDKCVGDASVAEELHDVEYVFGLVIFHRGFPVAEGVEGYVEYSRVLQFLGDELSLAFESSALGS